MLREQGHGVAGGSLHMQGRAIDVPPGQHQHGGHLRDAAFALQRGGVGSCRSSDFVHLDTGRIRRW